MLQNKNRDIQEHINRITERFELLSKEFMPLEITLYHKY